MLISLNVIYGEIMNRMWENIMLPIIKFKNIKYIVEIGADEGINTKNILNYCIDNNAKLVSIDPKPNFDVNLFQKEYNDYFTFFKELSLERLPFLNDYDCILIDGDHNWYTVFNELQIIGKNFVQDNFPLIFLHDVSWPYGRRDLYYNPEDIPSDYLNDYSKLGMHPDSEELLPEYGLNTDLFNANKENTPKNGVLTAIEDFMKESSLDLEFHFVPIFFGLGILHKKDDELYNFIEKTIFNEDILSLVELFYIKSDINKSTRFLKEVKHCKKLSDMNLQKDDKIKHLNQEIENNMKTLSEIKEDLSTKNFQLTYLDEKNHNLTNENALQKQHVIDLKSEIVKLENELNIKNDVLNSLNRNNNQLIKTNEIQLDEINGLKEEIDNLNKTIGIFTEKNNVLRNLHDTQQSEIVRLKEYKVTYSEKSFDLIQERRKLKRLLNQKNLLNDKIKKLQDENNFLDDDLSDLKEIIDEKQNELDNLNEIYQNTVKMKYNLEQENAYLRNLNRKLC